MGAAGQDRVEDVVVKRVVEERDHVVNPICHQATASVLFLNGRIPSFRARGENF